MTLNEAIEKCVNNHSCIVCESGDAYFALMSLLEAEGMLWCTGKLPTSLSVEGVGGVPIGIFINEANRLQKSQSVSYIKDNSPIYYSDTWGKPQISMYTFEEAFFGMKGE